MVRYCQTVRRYDKCSDNGNVRWCPALVSVGVPGVDRCSQGRLFAVWRGGVGEDPTACPMQPYLDYKYILPHPRNYCKYFLQFIAFLYLLIILSSANKCIGRKRYLSRPILPPRRPGNAGDPCRGCIKTEKREFSDTSASN